MDSQRCGAVFPSQPALSRKQFPIRHASCIHAYLNELKIFFHKLHPFLHLASSTSANIAASLAAMRPNEFKQAILTEDTS
jgi:hypothetical protein